MRNSGKQHSGMLPTALLACAAVVLVNPILEDYTIETVDDLAPRGAAR